MLTVTTPMPLSARRLGEWRLRQHAIALALLVAALSAWAAWSATGATGLRSENVLAAFGMATALGMRRQRRGAAVQRQRPLRHGMPAPYAPPAPLAGLARVHLSPSSPDRADAPSGALRAEICPDDNDQTL